MISEEPATGESQGNGKIEESGKTVIEFVKVFKDQIEFKANMTLDPQAKVMQWLVRWAAMAYNRYKRGPDGKTAYERQKGRKCRIEVIPFAEKVMYKRLKSGDSHKNVLESRWEEGLWLGHARTSE